MTGTILQFPLKQRQEAIATKKLEMQAFESTEELIADAMNIIAQYLMQEGGIDIVSDDTIYDAILVEDSIRSLIYASMDEYHELQPIAYDLYEDVVEVCECDDEQLEE